MARTQCWSEQQRTTTALLSLVQYLDSDQCLDTEPKEGLLRTQTQMWFAERSTSCMYQVSWQITPAIATQNKWMHMPYNCTPSKEILAELLCTVAWPRGAEAAVTEPKLRSVSCSEAERPCVSWVLAQTTPQLLGFAHNKAVTGQPLILTFLCQF